MSDISCYKNISPSVKDDDEIIVRCKIDKSWPDAEPSKPGKTYVYTVSNSTLRVAMYLTVLDEEVPK